MDRYLAYSCDAGRYHSTPHSVVARIGPVRRGGVVSFQSPDEMGGDQKPRACVPATGLSTAHQGREAARSVAGVAHVLNGPFMGPALGKNREHDRV